MYQQLGGKHRGRQRRRKQQHDQSKPHAVGHGQSERESVFRLVHSRTPSLGGLRCPSSPFGPNLQIATQWVRKTSLLSQPLSALSSFVIETLPVSATAKTIATDFPLHTQQWFFLAPTRSHIGPDFAQSPTRFCSPRSPLRFAPSPLNLRLRT